MKNHLLAVVGIAAALTSAAIAGPEAPPPGPAPIQTAPSSTGGFYVGADGGLFWLQDRSYDLGPLSADVHYKTGWGVDVPVGYNFGNGLSLGLSGGYYSADVSSISLGGYSVRPGDFGVNVRTQLVPIFAEASYTFHLVGGLSFDVGGGVGAAYTRDSAAGYYNSEWDFAFEGTAGLSYQVCPNASVRLGYRYTFVDERDTSHLNGHALELGFRLTF